MRANYASLTTPRLRNLALILTRGSNHSIVPGSGRGKDWASAISASTTTNHLVNQAIYRSQTTTLLLIVERKNGGGYDEPHERGPSPNGFELLGCFDRQNQLCLRQRPG
jgi:hypothetical protein